MFNQGFHHPLGLMAVCRQYHGKPRNGPRHRNILQGMMGHAQGAVADAAADSHQLNIGGGIRHIHLDLLDASHAQETSG
ncbi:hypothetical protein D3C76_1375300 [compost metagenome]